MSIQPGRSHVIACTTVLEEMLPVMPKGVSYQRLELGLHTNPDKLRSALQDAIEATDPSVDTILLGYGLCSRAVAGLRSGRHTLVVPRIDDCIGIFLGSASEYSRQHSAFPGTLYMTKGWIEAGGTPLSDQSDLVKKYGPERARSIRKRMLANYTRLVFIRTGGDQDTYRQRSQAAAAELELRYEEIAGSGELVRGMVFGPWNGDFVIAPPGREISFLDFRQPGPAA